VIFVFGDRSKVIPCKGDRRKKRQKEQVTAGFDIYCHPNNLSLSVDFSIIKAALYKRTGPKEYTAGPVTVL
jgi:hypothetical protein